MVIGGLGRPRRFPPAAQPRRCGRGGGVARPRAGDVGGVTVHPPDDTDERGRRRMRRRAGACAAIGRRGGRGRILSRDRRLARATEAIGAYCPPPFSK
ncbi:MAG: hypothetical protein NZ699_12960 [Roseiflexus sp.]|nr:hypothetical protein [Roseiflexus sp.]